MTVTMLDYHHPPNAATHIGFLLVPGFSMLALMSALEPLRVANRLSQEPLFAWSIISLDGQIVTASNGLTLLADSGFEQAPDFHTLFICAGFEPERHSSPELLHWLKRLAGRGRNLGAIDTGCQLLARAGLLDGYRVTLHWERLASFREQFPSIEATDRLYEIDGNRLTCAGGTAATDMMLYLIAEQHQPELATAISEQFIRQPMRERQDSQRLSLCQRLGINNTHVLDTVDLMEQHIEQPLSMPLLASRVGVSSRQLERLFRRHLNTSPKQYYKGIRLTHAQRLVRTTSMSLLAIALACGFPAQAPFSRAYKSAFGIAPGGERKLSTHA